MIPKWAVVGLMLLTFPAQAAIEIFYLHNDQLGTPRVVTDDQKTVVWEGHVKPFGEMEVVLETITNYRRFPGQRVDIESRLHYNYFRDYDPSLGRYIQSDPIGFYGGLNTYAYVASNPISSIDPLGLVEWTGTQSTIAAGDGGGAVRFKFNLESLCVEGRKTKVEIVAGGMTLTAGLPISYTYSRNVTFKDANMTPDSSIFLGGSRYAYASWAAGFAGASYQWIQLGGAESLGGGHQFGWDASLAGGAGISKIVNTSVTQCGCD